MYDLKKLNNLSRLGGHSQAAMSAFEALKEGAFIIGKIRQFLRTVQ